MNRVLDGETYEVNETMAECALHDGRWDQEGGFCVFDDAPAFGNYLQCVRVDRNEEPVKEQMPEPDAILTPEGIATLEEFATEIERGKLAYTGLSPDAPVVQNERGGLQSVVEGRFDLLPPVAMFELAKVMQHGAEKYAPRNWMKIDVDSHLNHLLQHVFAYLAGDTQDDHLAHALARAAMAVEVAKLGVVE
jgi:hypothetical protein